MLRELLRQHPDGLSTSAAAAITGIRANTLARTMHGMPDVYIDRWGTPKRGQWVAVWCIVNVPDDCPKPGHGGRKVATEWRT